MATHLPKGRRHITAKRLVGLAVILLLLYVVVPQVGDFKQSFSIIEKAKLDWLVLGVLAAIGTYLAAAGEYYLLALKPIGYVRTFLVQCASAFTNRLLPAGIGGISLFVDYLYRQKHTKTQAGVVVAVNNLLGFIGNIIIVVAIAVFGVRLQLAFRVPVWAYFLFAGLIIIACIVLLAIKFLRVKVVSIFFGILHNVVRYRLHPARLLGALILAIVLTLFYAAVLYCCMRALGWNVAASKVFLVFIGSVVIATVTPTPGGLVGAEAAITAGFVACGLPASDSLAIALTYRLITYWLPLVVGFGVFEVLGRRQII